MRDHFRRSFALTPRLATALVALALAACGGRDPSPTVAATEPREASGDHPASPAGSAENLYRSWGCSICHGIDRKGGKNAPTLTRLSPEWRVDTLADYLLDPAKWRESDPRIGKLAERYPKLTMPPSNHAESERRALAAWLLAGGSP